MPIKVKCVKDPSLVRYLCGFVEGQEYLATPQAGYSWGLPYSVWVIQPSDLGLSPVECPVPIFDQYFEEVEERNHRYVEGMTDTEVGLAIAARQKARELLRAKAREFLAQFR